MSRLILATQFLTRIPLSFKEEDGLELGLSSVYFPVVGAIIGIILCGIVWILGAFECNALVISSITVVTLIIITGGIHMDGLADMVDAFYAGKNREDILRVMRDPHIGTMGVLVVVSAVMLKTALLFSISPKLLPNALVAMCVLGRWAMVISMKMAPYARSDGKAKPFIEATGYKQVFVATVMTIACLVLTWHIQGLIIMAAVAIAAITVTLCARLKLGGITGDTLGATDEICEVAALFTLSIMQGGF